MFPRIYNDQVNFWDDIYADLEALQDSTQTVIVDSITEPTQSDWESAWIAKGYSLPIPSGVELYWYRGGRLWGLYGIVDNDVITVLNGSASRTKVRWAEGGLFLGLGNDPIAPNPYSGTYEYAVYEMTADGGVDSVFSLAPYSYIGRRSGTPSIHRFRDTLLSDGLCQHIVSSQNTLISGTYPPATSGSFRLHCFNAGAVGFIRQTSTYVLATGSLVKFSCILGNLSGSAFDVQVGVTNNPNTEQFLSPVWSIPANSAGVYEFTFTPTASWAGGCILTIVYPNGSGAGQVAQVGEVQITSAANPTETAIIDGQFENGVSFLTNWTESNTNAETGSAVKVTYVKLLRYNYDTNAVTFDIITRTTNVDDNKLIGVKPDGSKFVLGVTANEGTLIWDRSNNTFTTVPAGVLAKQTSDVTPARALWSDNRIFASKGAIDDDGTDQVSYTDRHLLYAYNNYVYYDIDANASSAGYDPWYEFPVIRINGTALVEEPVTDFPNFAAQAQLMQEPLNSNLTYSPATGSITIPGLMDGIPVQRISDTQLLLDANPGFLEFGSALYGDPSTGRVWRLAQYIDPVQDWLTVDRYIVNTGNDRGERYIDLTAVGDVEDYEHILIEFEPETITAASYIVVEFNDDSVAANYDTFYLRPQAATIQVEEFYGVTHAGIPFPTGINAMGHHAYMLILDYKGTSHFKQALIFGGVTLNVTTTNVRGVQGMGIWENTAPITKLRLNDTNPNAFAQGINVRVSLLRGKGRFFRDYVYDSHMA